MIPNARLLNARLLEIWAQPIYDYLVIDTQLDILHHWGPYWMIGSPEEV